MIPCKDCGRTPSEVTSTEWFARTGYWTSERRTEHFVVCECGKQTPSFGQWPEAVAAWDAGVRVGGKP